MNLSERQIEIVNHKDGALLVTASAGSGKTRVLTERIKRLLEEEEGNFHVLALTFTNKTAKEMKDRLDGVKDIDRRAFIGTIHGFCHEVIEKHGYAIGLNEVPQIFEKNEDKISILIQVFEKKGNEDLQKYYINKTTQEQEKFIYNALSYISSQKKNLKGISRFNELDKDIDNRNIQKMYDEYNNLLRDQNAMDFDEVIISAYRIFAERPSIAKIYRKQYQYISIDEAQDLNFAQYEFLKILCNGEHQNILMVGDSKQSLYHFNGSDKKFMENYFVVDFNAQIKKLDLNYRSSKAVIDVANKINPGSMQGFKTDIIGNFQIQTCLNEEEEAIWITDKIETLLKQGIQESEIAILARNRFLFKEIENELQKRNIKFYFKKNGESLNLDSTLMKVFDLGLRILSNPFDQLHFIEITRMIKIDFDIEFEQFKDGLEKLKNLHTHIPDDFKSNFTILLSSWEVLNDNNRLQFREALKIVEIHANSCEDEERQEILSDIKLYEELWSIYAKSTSSELKSLQHFKTQIALGIIAHSQDETGITLSTIHLSKGLEFDSVFIIGVNQGSLPYYKAVQTGGRTLEEEKNIFYVAVTRAERSLYVTYPQNRFMPWNKDVLKKQSSSIYLVGLENCLA